jgi:hypothetical protein
MSDMRWIALAGGLLCAFITPADTYGAVETRGTVPNFSSGDFPWVPLSPNMRLLPPVRVLSPTTMRRLKGRETWPCKGGCVLRT